MAHAFARDVAFALRRLRQAPGFAILAVLTLGLGLGLGASLGSLLNSLVLRPLPVRQPDRLVVVSRNNRQEQARWMPLTTMDALARDAQTFEALCGYAEGGLFTIDPGGSPMQSPFEFVSGGCYALFGVRAHIGRLISEREAPGGGEPERVAVLGYRFWQQHYGGDPNVIGRTLRAKAMALTIIGVTPPGFSGLQVDVAPDVTVPATILPALGVGQPGATQVNYVVARLRPGVTLEQARARVSAAWPAVQAETMPTGLSDAQQVEFQSFDAHLESLAGGFSALRKGFARPLSLLTALAGLLLVLTVANLSGFLLARTAAREHELAVRAALGASTGRVAATVVGRALGVAARGVVIGAPCALAASTLTGSLLYGLTPSDPLSLSITVVALAAVAVAGSVVPARRAARTDPIVALKSE